jgi:hypothetical protein
MSGNLNDNNPSKLGGGVPGGQPKGGLLGGGGGSTGGSGMTGSSARGRSRIVLRRAFGNMSLWNNKGENGRVEPGGSALTLSAGHGGTDGSDGWKGFCITPFRAAMNAGDVLGTRNQIPYVSGAGFQWVARPSNQVNNVRRASNAGIKTLSGPVRSKPWTEGADNPGQAKGSLWSGNQTYVYDSSDYIRFKKLQAKNNNYNDKSFGGDQHFASQVPLGRVRR